MIRGTLNERYVLRGILNERDVLRGILNGCVVLRRTLNTFRRISLLIGIGRRYRKLLCTCKFYLAETSTTEESVEHQYREITSLTEDGDERLHGEVQHAAVCLFAGFDHDLVRLDLHKVKPCSQQASLLSPNFYNTLAYCTWTRIRVCQNDENTVENAMNTGHV